MPQMTGDIELNQYQPSTKNNVIQMTNTPHAYERLIADETDIVFVAGPSDAQGKAAVPLAKRSNSHLSTKRRSYFLSTGKIPSTN